MRTSELEIVYDVPRRVDPTLFYQRHYLNGFDRIATLRYAHEPLALKLAPTPDAKIDLELKLQPFLKRLRKPRTTGHVGSYTAGPVRFAIDAHDRREPQDAELLASSDVYFKANYWPGDPYPANVRPIVNGSGMLDLDRIDLLRSLRMTEKDLDLVYVARLWGGREHGVRLFEQAAVLDAKTHLHAVFPAGWPDDETRALMRRLDAAGVSYSTADMPNVELLQLLARSKVVLLRAGKHMCIPWRMIELLCLGSCVVVDSAFRPQWPVPLVAGTHYVDCGVDRPDDTEPAPTERYSRVAETLAALLTHSERQAEIRMSNAAYFDEHAAPEQVGAYVAATIAS